MAGSRPRRRAGSSTTGSPPPRVRSSSVASPTGRVWKLGTELHGFVGSLVRTTTLWMLLLVMAFAVVYAVRHRGRVRTLAFEVVGASAEQDGLALATLLSRTLDDIAVGSTSALDVDCSLQMASDSGPPTVTVPGTGLSLASVVAFIQTGPFAEIEVRPTLLVEGSSYRVLLHVQGLASGSRTMETERTSDRQRAVLEAAPALYELLNPTALAAYLHERDPEQGLAVIRQVLAREGELSSSERASAYRVWGALLRSRGDLDGARERFAEAIHMHRGWGVLRALGKPDRSRAALYLDLGHTSVWSPEDRKSTRL